LTDRQRCRISTVLTLSAHRVPRADIDYETANEKEHGWHEKRDQYDSDACVICSTPLLSQPPHGMLAFPVTVTWKSSGNRALALMVTVAAVVWIAPTGHAV